MKHKLYRLSAGMLALVILLLSLSGAVMAADGEEHIFAGSGTEQDPYQLATGDDLRRLSDSVSGGQTYKNTYFSMTGDITLPSQWTPIGTTSSRFAGAIDGGGHTLTVPEGSLSLIGTPSGASVHDLNLYGSKIPGYGLVQGYTTGASIDIQRVTIKSGSRILYAGLIGGYGNTAVTIRDCVAEKGVVIGDDGTGFWGNLGNTDYSYSFVGTFNHRDNIGSFAGAFNGTISGCVSYATVYGRHNVGGIVGMKGQSARDFYVNDCAFYGNIIATGQVVGGIVGSGYVASSAPSTPCVTIENCYATGAIQGGDQVGGIFGGEPGCDKGTQNNGIGRIRNNFFSGILTAQAESPAIGGVIGYMRYLGRYNVIGDNYYVETCGASQAIGAVGTTGDGCDADTAPALAIPAADLINGRLVSLLNGGAYGRSDYHQGEEHPLFGEEKHVTGITSKGKLESTSPLRLTAYTDYSRLETYDILVNYSDGTQETVKAAQGQFSGVDFTTPGIQMAHLTYRHYTLTFGVNVQAIPDGTIMVSLTVLGDDAHGADAAAMHTLAGDNLTTWLAKTYCSLPKDASVADLLDAMAEKTSLSFAVNSGSYVTSVTCGEITLKEFTNGGRSGWQYMLNGVRPDLNISQQKLQSGDAVLLHYTDDYTQEYWNPSATLEQVIEQLRALPSVDAVSASDQAAIYAARDAYCGLSPEEKEQIVAIHKEKLDAALCRLAALQKAQLPDRQEIYQALGRSLEKNAAENGLSVSSEGGEWVVLGLARSGLSVPAGYFATVETYVREHADEHGRLHRAKSTENARVILALSALGLDVTDVAGHNLLLGLADMTYVRRQGINGSILALIALDSHAYAIPADSTAAQPTTREGLIAAILEAQQPDGSWSLDGDGADVDLTAMAIQALAPYAAAQATVHAAVEQALTCLAAQQMADGSFESRGVVNSESCAQVLLALTALDIDPITDPRFVKNGFTLLDVLERYYTEGGLSHGMGEPADAMSTEQGYLALVAYQRMIRGQTALFTMTDVPIRTNTAAVDTPVSTPEGPAVPSTGDRSAPLYAALLLWPLSGLCITCCRRRQADR